MPDVPAFKTSISLFLSAAEPNQAAENQSILCFTFECGGKVFVGLVLMIDVGVPHVEIIL